MWVIKIGGSLAGAPALPAWLAQLAADPVRRWVLVPGGGPYADAVREMQRRWRFDDASAHRMALQAMALYAAQVRAMAPSLGIAPALDAMTEGQGSVVWSPGPGTAAALAGLPEDWRLTSDSIALWLALRVRAEGLVLLKSAPPPVAGSASEMAAAGYLDAWFPALLREARMPVCWLSARDDPAQVLPGGQEAWQRIRAG